LEEVALPSKKETVQDVISVRRAAIRKAGANELPNFIGLDKKSVTNLSDKLQLTIEEKGFGIVKEQYPPAYSNMTSDMTVKLIYGPPNYE
jgi:hypothetical protein